MAKEANFSISFLLSSTYKVDGHDRTVVDHMQHSGRRDSNLSFEKLFSAIRKYPSIQNISFLWDDSVTKIPDDINCNKIVTALEEFTMVSRISAEGICGYDLNADIDLFLTCLSLRCDELINIMEKAKDCEYVEVAGGHQDSRKIKLPDGFTTP